MKQINYLEIIKKSFTLLWSKKQLCFFGFLVMLGSGGAGFVSNWNGAENNSQKDFSFNFPDNIPLLVTVVLLFLLILLLLVALRIIGQAAIIRFTGATGIEKSLSLISLFKRGKEYLWRLLTLDALFFLALFALLATLSLPVIFLLTAKSNLLAFFVGLFALLIFIPVCVLSHFVKKFAYMYLILSDFNLRISIEKSYGIFRSNVLKSLFFSLLMMAIGLASGIALLAVLIIIGMPLVIFGAVLYLALSEIGLFIALGLGLLFFAAIFIVIQSAFETFNQICWTLFFLELEGLKTEEETRVSIIAQEELTKPEHA